MRSAVMSHQNGLQGKKGDRRHAPVPKKLEEMRIVMSGLRRYTHCAGMTLPSGSMKPMGRSRISW